MTTATCALCSGTLRYFDDDEVVPCPACVCSECGRPTDDRYLPCSECWKKTVRPGFLSKEKVLARAMDIIRASGLP